VTSKGNAKPSNDDEDEEFYGIVKCKKHKRHSECQQTAICHQYKNPHCGVNPCSRSYMPHGVETDFNGHELEVKLEVDRDG
jgi:hypothetical protein